MANDPIHQFQITELAPLGNVGGIELAFTNSAAFMFATIIAVGAFLILGSRSKSLVPGRWQLMSEMTYQFVETTLRDSAGSEGMRFFPLVFSLFTFVLFANLFGMFPYFFTITSHLIVTFALAMLVFLTVVIYGFVRHGFGFLKLFVPSGIPGVLVPVVVFIEFLSFLSRPVSLSIRLFANMLAGHITLKVFAGFVTTLTAAGVYGIFAVVPFAMIIALTALEFLVAFLQAYVFTVLTCMYLNDALHPSH